MSLLTPREQARRRELLASAARRAPSVVVAERKAAQRDNARGFADFPRDLPLIVIVANAQNFGANSKNADHGQLWVEMSRAWMELSESSEFVIADGSGHMIHRDRPAIVVDAVERMVQRMK